MRGQLYVRVGDPRRGLIDLNRSLSLNPRNALALNQRGQAYDELNDRERAIAEYSQAIEVNPRNSPQLISIVDRRG